MKQSDLNQFIGSDEFYRLGPLFPGLVITQGVKFVAENDATWLVTDIASFQLVPKVKRERFQVWKITKEDGKDGAWLVCEDGNDHPVFRKHYDYAELPLPQLTIWVITDGGDGMPVRRTMLLPSEY